MLTKNESSTRFNVQNMSYGIKIKGLDLKEINNSDCQDLLSLIYTNKLVVIECQKVSAEEYVQIAKKLAEPIIYLQENYHHPEHPEIFVSSSSGYVNDRNMGMARTGYYWHADYSFDPEPQAFTMIYPQILPKGERSTYFIDMAETLRAMPKPLRDRISSTYSLHDGHARYKIRKEDVGKPLNELLDYLGENSPYGIHPTVIKHPVTEEEVLFTNSGFTSRILGMSVFESRALLSRVFSFAEDMGFANSYCWNEGDIAIWDNRSLIHRSGKNVSGEDAAMFKISLRDGLPLTKDPIPAQEDLKEIYPCF